MEGRIGLAAALAAITLAAGIESASAVEYVAETESNLARIESATSADELRVELDALRMTDPSGPMVGTITRHIIRLAQVRTAVNANVATDAMSDDASLGPY
jgi:hypothetical protein